MAIGKKMRSSFHVIRPVMSSVLNGRTFPTFKPKQNGPSLLYCCRRPQSLREHQQLLLSRKKAHAPVGAVQGGGGSTNGKDENILPAHMMSKGFLHTHFREVPFDLIL